MIGSIARCGPGGPGQRAQAKDPPTVEAQAFPHGIATLHDRIERAHARLVAVDEATVDVHDQVAIALIETLQHPLGPCSCCGA